MVQAEFSVGLALMEGSGVDKDEQQAVHWYEHAAKHGHADAQCALGVCYEYGVGVAESLDWARIWYAKAAAQHSPQANSRDMQTPMHAATWQYTRVKTESFCRQCSSWH